ncbi:hypothetical protein ACROYT_G031589 [Oculina patagonica]
MPGYQLYYFDVRGAGEVCRLAFAAANVEFEDIRFSVAGDREEWQKEKASGRPPLGQVPFIVTPEGKVLGQSSAITKYICKQAGLSPTDSFDEALADMITDGIADLKSGLGKIHFERDEAKKEELTKDMLENTLPTRLQKFETILKDRNEGKGFFVGDKLSYPDIDFFDLMNIFTRGEPTVPEQLHKFPLLVEHYKRVLEVPGIKAWVEKRPKSDH